MKILNYGSLNCDNVYTVPHMVKAGETLSSASLEIFPGGKGLNQSIALARAGAQVCHAGLIGEDGRFLVELAEQNGVDCSLIEERPGRTGHAVIQVDPSGQNCILLYGGANQLADEAYIRRVLTGFGPGDLLLLQNEMSLPERMIDLAWEMGLTVALNPSPCSAALAKCDFRKVEWLILNELEGTALSGEPDVKKIPQALFQRFPHMKIVLTLGADGVRYADSERQLFQPAFPVKAVDTTGAGDTFTGFFLAALLEGQDVPEALQLAAKAAALAVSRKGAASSIPTRCEVDGSTGDTKDTGDTLRQA